MIEVIIGQKWINLLQENLIECVWHPVAIFCYSA